MTLGSFITGDADIRVEANNPLFQHEYGHYLQSQRFGLFYIPKIGIPSILSKGDFFDHGNHPVEQDANIRALTYFMENAEGFTIQDWNFNRIQGGHPIIGFDPTLPFDNEDNLAALTDGRLRLEWFDYFLGPNVPNYILHGLLNALILNSRF